MNAAQHVLLTGIQLYRWMSPAKTFIFGPLGQCRFTPSCSAYALESITKHGAGAGSWLALKRLCRCHPWGGCGEDPVPPEQHDQSPASRVVAREEFAMPDTTHQWQFHRMPNLSDSSKE